MSRRRVPIDQVLIRPNGRGALMAVCTGCADREAPVTEKGRYRRHTDRLPATAPPPPRQEPPRSAQLTARERAAAVLYLLPDAPPEVMTAAYRALSLRLHPDRGGSTERMSALNAAYDMLRNAK